ncbi:MAG: ABC transporter permease [Sphaerochaetaceae bacterium]
MADKVKKKRSHVQEVLHRFSKNKGAMIGLGFILLLVVLACLGNVLYDYETDIIGQHVEDRFIKPCLRHPFGTDNYGRDLFSRVIYGARASLPVSFLAVLVSLCMGVIFGSFAGYHGGLTDNVIMRIMDIFAAIPSIMMAIALVAVMGPSSTSLILAVGIIYTPSFARITRASVMTVRNQEFVESARAIGLSTTEIIFRHIIPNCMSPIIVQTTLRMGSAIILASGMSYLGIGVRAPMPEWGSLLSAGRNYIRDNGYLTIFPGLMIMVTVIAFNMIGDGLRDATDPKLKK